ncbi:MATE family efflux transporter [Basilea psittacipulmonis]|uniref:Multidrug-efflux transporter n=1 Tax=Basilea psittacipulmonis DSM 24701 TaxID=1072685 RepID=A0A077DH92_9BURK|nr:MATE family efflux transporter [Basilea psittacipulmonis]AIL32847.1 hypothetical protein IX83_05525 [Basilea psittacipulmonis DSM 24701]
MSIFKTIAKQTAPIYITSLASMSFGVMDTAMLGHYSPDSLQAMSLATSIYVTVYISQLGLLEALIPICSQLFGKKDYDKISYFVVQGYWFAIFFSIIGAIILLHPEIFLWMLSVDLDDQVLKEIKVYLSINTLSLLASNLFRVQYALCTSMQKPQMIMYINLISMVFKGIFNYLFIFGWFFIQPMGSTGAAISSCLVAWIMFFLGFWVIKNAHFYTQLKFSSFRPCWQAQKEILKLGLPMGGSYLVEVSSFTLMALLAANEGKFVSGAHQIMANLAAVFYMFPMSLGIASCSIIAYTIAQQNQERINQIVRDSFILAFSVGLFTVVVTTLFKDHIIAAYTNIDETKAIIAGLLCIMPFFHLSDVLQCMMANILRAYKIATTPFVLQTLILFIFGLGGGWYFGYYQDSNLLAFINTWATPHVPKGIADLWIMCSIALFICGSMLCIWYFRYIKKIPLEKFN